MPYEFIQWLIFELVLILLFAVLYLLADGRIRGRFTRSENFRSWQRENGRVVKWMSILLIITSLAVLAYKYHEITEAEAPPPSLDVR